MDLIPALDLRGGRVVRLAQGDDARRTLYGDDAPTLLARFAEAGVPLAHVVDLDAAFGEAPQRALLEDLAARVGAGSSPALQLGGGLREARAVEWALDAGFARAVVGSMVGRDPDLFAELATRHPGRLVPALDVAHGELRIAGWREEAPLPLSRVCRRLERLPCPAVLVTDVERDGMAAGPNLGLACRVGRACGMPALLSGGVASLSNLAAAARCREIGGAVVGKALLDGAFTLAAALAACRPAEGT